jgi:hypothetical protein
MRNRVFLYYSVRVLFIFDGFIAMGFAFGVTRTVFSLGVAVYVLIGVRPAFSEMVVDASRGSAPLIDNSISTPPTDKKPIQLSSPDPWEVEITPYGFLSSFNGDVTIRGFTTPELAADPQAILQALEFYSAGRVEVWHRRWGVILDLFYADVGYDFDTTITLPPGTYRQGQVVTIPARRVRAGRRFVLPRAARTFVVPSGRGLDVLGPQVDLNAQLGQYDLGGSYRFSFDAPSFRAGKTLFIEPIAGLRLGKIGLKAVLTPGRISGLLGAPGRVLEGKDTYVEPFFGGKVAYRLSKRVSMSVRGDVGGFGIGNGSHFTWNLVSLLGFHVTENVILKVGYAIKDINYTAGRSSGFNVNFKGPWLGLTLRL